MDRVKFGRALGYGARHAAKAIKSAAEAASAPDPASANRPRATAAAQPSAVRPTASVGSTVASAASAFQQARAVMGEVHTTKAKVNAAARKSMLTPVKQFSSTVLLQVMGTIFGLFALVMSQAVWRQRAVFHAPYMAAPALKLYMTALVFGLFAWFCVTSFVRANRIGK